nr:ATP synthase F0 subunit 8 [Diplatys flavicollis]
MPQMAPLMWLFLYFVVIFVLLGFGVINYMLMLHDIDSIVFNKMKKIDGEISSLIWKW